MMLYQGAGIVDVPAYDIFHTCSTRCIHSGVEHFGFFPPVWQKKKCEEQPIRFFLGLSWAGQS